MSEKYNDLYNLINDNAEAGKFFDSLPYYVQETIIERSNNILTKNDLYSYADNILRGDK